MSHGGGPAVHAPSPLTLPPAADERWRAKYIKDYEGGLYIAYNGRHHEEPQSAVTVSEVSPPPPLPAAERRSRTLHGSGALL